MSWSKAGTKRAWEVGQVVSCGFVKNLTVVGLHQDMTTWNNELVYTLTSQSGKAYEFRPHVGLTRV